MIEEVIEKHLPKDVMYCVVEIPEAMKGSRIAVAITAPLDEKKLIKAISHELPNIALPKHFVIFEELPKMGSGKFDFRTITEMVRDRLQAGK